MIVEKENVHVCIRRFRCKNVDKHCCEPVQYGIFECEFYEDDNNL